LGEFLGIQRDNLSHSKTPQKIPAYNVALDKKLQKFCQKDGFFVDKKETSDHL
jgi:hypothetical protein